jgi:acetoin utilization deacetylase AcuC-like enzyme
LPACRHKGIQRVALLDFDVHHGNGTRACVSNTTPGKLSVPYSTPMSEGVHIYNTYQPWFDSDDDDNILFASVQGYGPKSSARPGAGCRHCVSVCMHANVQAGICGYRRSFGGGKMRLFRRLKSLLRLLVFCA